MSNIQIVSSAGEFQKLLTSTDKLVVVDFHATWW